MNVVKIQNFVELAIICSIVIQIGYANLSYAMVLSICGILINAKKRSTSNARRIKTSKEKVLKICNIDNKYVSYNLWNTLIYRHWCDFKYYSFIESGFLLIPILLGIKLNNQAIFLGATACLVALKGLDVLEYMLMLGEKRKVNSYIKNIKEKGSDLRC